MTTPFISDPLPGDPEDEGPDPATRVTKLLRACGATLLLSSAATFLLQRWNTGDDVFRYGLLLVQTIVLVVSALVCGARVRESRGARTLFALTLAMLPAHFGVLGGLLYSRFPLDDLATGLPSHVVWVAPTPTHALVALAVALLVLVPTAYLSLLALVRSEAPRLLGLLFGMNALLLVPFRNPDVTGILIGAAGLALAYLETRAFPRSIALGTLEGRLVRLMLAVPPVILAVRAITLYSPREFFVGSCLVELGVGLFAVSPRLLRDRTQATKLRALSMPLVLVGWALLADATMHGLGVPDSLKLPLAGLPLAALLVVFGRVVGEDGGWYRVLAELVAVTTVALNLFHDTVAATLVALSLGLLLLVAGTYSRKPLRAVIGGTLATAALALQLRHAIEFSHLLNWGSLSVLGVALVFVAAYVERHPERFARLASMFFTEKRRN